MHYMVILFPVSTRDKISYLKLYSTSFYKVLISSSGTINITQKCKNIEIKCIIPKSQSLNQSIRIMKVEKYVTHLEFNPFCGCRAKPTVRKYVYSF